MRAEGGKWGKIKDVPTHVSRYNRSKEARKRVMRDKKQQARQKPTAWHEKTNGDTRTRGKTRNTPEKRQKKRTCRNPEKKLVGQKKKKKTGGGKKMRLRGIGQFPQETRNQEQVHVYRRKSVKASSQGKGKR